MKTLRYISLVLAVLLSCCQKFDEQPDSVDVGVDTSGSVTITEDGLMRISASLSAADMAEISVSSRASADFEEVIYGGWCLVFGENETYFYDDGDPEYSDDSPLLLKIPVEVNANGTFFVNMPAYDHVAFLRFVANLTDREEATLGAAVAWGDLDDGIDNGADEGDDGDHYIYKYDNDAGLTVKTLIEFDYDQAADYATFGNYKYQSVGLDGIYDFTYGTMVNIGYYENDANGVESYTYDSVNTENQPDPAQTTDCIPMSSIGFVFDEGISISTLQNMFSHVIYMVRVCAKMDVTVNDSGFELQKIYMLDCAQESRLRSTVLSGSFGDYDSYAEMVLEGGSTSEYFGIPIDLGGTIDYLPLEEEVKDGNTSSPIYFYPNWGGDYSDNNGEVNLDINPQYVVIKGHAAGYEEAGYYKIALKAQYPMTYSYNDDETINEVIEYSEVSYDILRNSHFNINLLTVDKPGYKTLEDAEDPENPASNISYSITIITTDGRKEILVSNGTYYAELNTSRVYMMGYGDEGFQDATVSFTLYPDDSHQIPAFYVTGEYGVEVTDVAVDKSTATEVDFDGETWFKVEASDEDLSTTVTYNATSSGRIAIHVGDMLKYIPVEYEEDYVTYADLKYVIEGDSVTHAASTDLATTFGVSFAYDKVLELNDEGAESDIIGNDIFEKDGSVTMNKDYDDIREVRVQIYPQNIDGIAKLYFKQAPRADIELFDANGTDKYFIYTPRGMGAFSNIVNGYDNVYGATVNDRITFDNVKQRTTNSKLLNDVDIADICAATDGGSWIPIGKNDGGDYNNYCYAAVFDGNNKKVSSIYIDSSDSHQGLFGYASGEIKNVTVTGNITSSGQNVGGITGYNNKLVTNCHNEVNVRNTSTNVNTGGVSGAMSGGGTISGCSNSGTISCNGTLVGGIVGHSYESTVKNCSNTGAVFSTLDQVGGIAGKMTSSTMTGCSNDGDGSIYSNSTQVGGVVGYMTEGGYMSECGNNAKVGGGANIIGGVVGQMDAGGELSACYNAGAVTSATAYIGGVVGNVVDGSSSTYSTITGCYNNGSVTSTIGSVWSTNTSGVDIVNSSDSNTGGVVGYAGSYNQITDCYSTDDESCEVASTGNNVGGIVGYLYRYATINDCINRGNVTGTGDPDETLRADLSGTKLGGVVGYAYADTEVNNCENHGTMLARNYHSGGVVGYLGYWSSSDAQMNNCTNYGDVTSTFFEVGGVVGITSYSTLTNCVNEGDVYPATEYSEGGRTIGGVIGYMYTGTEMYNCVNRGDVTGDGTYKSYLNPGTGTTTSNRGVGGLVGYCYSQSIRIENSYNTGTITATGSDITTIREVDHVGGAGGAIGFLSSSDPANNSVSTGALTSNSSYIYGVYNTGTVTAPTCAGGVIGSIDYSINASNITFYTYATIGSMYNRGTVTRTGTGAYFDPVIGYNSSANSSNINVSGAYYLENTASAYYNSSLSASCIETYMTSSSSTYGTLIYYLNNFHSGTYSNSWTQSAGTNDGFPIFTWQ